MLAFSECEETKFQRLTARGVLTTISNNPAREGEYNRRAGSERKPRTSSQPAGSTSYTRSTKQRQKGRRRQPADCLISASTTEQASAILWLMRCLTLDELSAPKVPQARQSGYRHCSWLPTTTRRLAFIVLEDASQAARRRDNGLPLRWALHAFIPTCKQLCILEPQWQD